MHAHSTLLLAQAQPDAPPHVSGGGGGTATGAASGAAGTATGGGGGTGTGTQTGSQTLPPAQPSSPFGGFSGMMFIALAVAMLFMMMTGPRKERKRREALLSSLKKGDRVQTAGGVIGTIVELRDSEVVLKVDENSNTRIKFTRGSIQGLAEEKTEPAA